MPSPVLPDDVKEIIPDPTASKCAAFAKVLLRFPVLMWKLIGYMFDADGNLSSDFLRLAQPTGTYEFSAAQLAEENRLLCDGRAVSRTTYADLFAVIGEDYGAGDGSTTFNLPDFQDRFPLGQSTTRPIASTGDGKLTMANIPEHSHLLANSSANSTSPDPLTAADEYLAWYGYGQLGPSGTEPKYALSPSLADAEPDIGRVGLTGETAANISPAFSPYLACFVYVRT